MKQAKGGNGNELEPGPHKGYVHSMIKEPGKQVENSRGFST